MKKNIFKLCLLTAISQLIWGGCKNKDLVKVGTEKRTEYANPVIKSNAPDPSIIRVGKYYYLYATEGSPKNMPIYQSENLIDWSLVGTVFSDATRPTILTGGVLWAPDINYINGQYVLYYSMAIWGSPQLAAIGRAVADHPAGPFRDMGVLIRSSDIGVNNSIDQAYIEDNGKHYMFWGSFNSIYAIELTTDGLNIKPGATKQRVAGNAYEGTYVHKKGNYFYLFGSVGTCCEGITSTYTTVVGRSENIYGPYVDKNGRDMRENHHEIVIANNNRFVGVGHNSEIVSDDEGNDWILYHGYDVKYPVGRRLLIDQVKWEQGWPRVEGNSGSTLAKAPIIH